MVARAGAVIALTALLVTLLAVLILRDPGFPPSAMVAARIILALSIVVAAVAMLWRPLNSLRLRNQSRTFERHLPAQSGRIETYLQEARRRERGEATPLIDLLAEDALVLAEQEPVSKAVPPQRLWIPAAAAALGVIALALMLALGQGEWGFGSRNLWFGTAIPREQIALRQIAVTPGNMTVRRNQDVPIRASVTGFKADSAEVFVRFGNAQNWERAPMRAGDDGKFDFTLYALREPLTYYVASNGTKSAEHRISVVDAPRIERMRLTYTYPSWTGLQPETDDVNRDIRAVAGTKVSVEVQTTAPLEAPTLMVDGSKSGLQTEGAWTRGIIEVKQPGHYRISAQVGEELVPLTDEHEISIIEDQQPTIEFAKPGRDWQASSIEEVPVEVHARDDFRLQNVELHYSVNGGEWKVTSLKSGAKDITGDTVLRLEEMGELQGKGGDSKPAEAAPSNGRDPSRLTPGDLVTYYAVAKDRKQAVQTDLFLIHVQPFERRFTQGQAGGMQGGGGGGDDQQNAISQRQREILLATWNLKRLRERPDNREKERLAENARMLAEAQGTLAEQARTLIDRAAARGVDSADPKNRELIDNLEQAAKAMQPAAKDLGEVKLAEAIPSEQKALQHLLRAEALYTDIEVQFRNSQAGGGGGGQQAGRDLAEMFELEMDLDKNQYETQSRAAGEESSQQLEDALRKLRELAQRQERLAREAARQQQQPRESERWKQEQLKRETEDLRKRLAELAKQDANSPSQQGQQQGQGQGQGGQSATARNAKEALDQVEKALQEMQGESGSGSSGNQSASGGQSGAGGQSRGGESNDKPGNPQSSARSAQLASRDLKKALEKLEQGRREGMAGSFDDLASRARQMLEEQRRGESELLNAFTQPGSGSQNPSGANQPGSAPSSGAGPGRRGLSWERAEALAEQKRSLQSQLEELQRDMQSSAQQHREDAPGASQRVGSAAKDVAESNLSAGLARSALELERGRGLQAATRERLLTEALENLDNDLDEAARIASNEARQRRSEKNEASPEELLAELSELRRAWQLAQANAQANQRGGPGLNGEPNENGANGPRDANGQRGANGERDPNSRNPGNQPGGDQQGDSESSQGGDSSSQAGGNGSQQGGNSQSGSRLANASPNTVGGNTSGGGDEWGGGGPNNLGGYARHFIEGDRGRLNGWSPPLASGALRPWADTPEFRQQAEEISRRLRDMLNRMPQNSLPPADISALRQLANRLRRTGTDPMEGEYRNMVNLVDQLELAALNASEKNRAAAATHTATPASDSPEYRETVAEYYRRLGGGTK
jgi:hypothetical protein